MPRSKPRVLVLDEEVPWPLNTGKRIRTFHLLSRLVDGFDIDLLVHGGADDAAIQALEETGVRVHEAPSRVREKKGLGFYVRLFENVFSRYPYSVTSHFLPDYVELLDRLLGDRRPDLIHCEWTPYARSMLDRSGTPWCVAAHNVESMIWERMAEHGNLAKRWFIGLQARRMRRFEAWACGACSVVIAVSAADAARLAELGARRTAVVDNGVDTRAVRPGPFEQREARSLVFVGSLDWRPNQDAVSWFLDEIHPRFREHGDFAVTIVGRNPPDWMARRCAATPGVELTGTVSDVAPYLRAAETAIVPLRIGGGSRLKILEALAAGLPVVSTSIGAEGLDLDSGDHWLRADSPEEFAAAVARLSSDPELRRSLSVQGRRRVEERYDWDRLAEIQAEVWREAIGAS